MAGSHSEGIEVNVVNDTKRRINLVLITGYDETIISEALDAIGKAYYAAKKKMGDSIPHIYISFVDNGSAIQPDPVYRFWGEELSHIEKGVTDKISVLHMINGRERYIDNPGRYDVFEKSPMFHVPKKVEDGRMYEGILTAYGGVEIPVILRRYDVELDGVQNRNRVCDAVRRGEFGNCSEVLFGEFGVDKENIYDLFCNPDGGTAEGITKLRTRDLITTGGPKIPA